MYIPVIGAVAGLLCLWRSMHCNGRKRLLQDTPTSKTTGVFMGFVELYGTAESEAPYTSYLAGAPCVLYSWNVSERWSRTVTENYRDSDGTWKTRTRHESGWTTVASGGESGAFYLQDDHGIILIRPDGAKLETHCIFNETCGRNHPLYYGKGPRTSIANSDHRRRFVENIIPLHQPVYVCGQARLREDIVAPEIAHHRDAPMFLISVRGEEEICSSFSWQVYGWWLAGLLLFGGGWALVQADAAGPSGSAWIIPALLAALVFGAITGVSWIWLVFNSLIRLRERVGQAWSLIDVQLKRRHDLVPSLLAVVEGYRDYELEQQQAIARLRAETLAPSHSQPADPLHALGSGIVALAEAYPELKANEHFIKLQQELVDTENRLALARGYYNEITTYYNSRLQVLPEKFVADLVSMKPAALLHGDELGRAVVHVNLTAGGAHV